MWSPNDDKLRALAEFAAGAGHEINNPIAAIVGRTQLLLKAETDPGKRDALHTILHQAWRVRDMIGDTMLYARPPQPVPQVFHIAPLVNELVGKFRTEFGSQGCDLHVAIPDALQLTADPTQFRVALAELLRNARAALRNTGGSIRVAAQFEETAVRVTVSDDGCGFRDEDREHLFDPFYSGRQAGRGLGFGLCKVWRIVDLHGGRIEVESRLGGPTSFHLLFPVVPPA